MDWASGITTTAFIRMFQDPSNRWFALYLLSAFLMAFFVYRWQARSDPELREEGFLPFAFPAHIYKHRSARVDYFYFFVNKLFFGVLFAELAIGSQVSSSGRGDHAWERQHLPDVAARWGFIDCRDCDRLRAVR